MDEWVRVSDAVILVMMTPLAVYLAISGVDDLFVDVAWLTLWIEDRIRSFKTVVLDRSAVERRIAIFVPLWKESAVIEQMLAHNIAALQYGRYTFFCGAYPNDEATLDAVREMESRSDRVQLAVCPHDGPTSKADCLNWIYQRMLDYERRTGERFELIVTHDAEDILHPESLQWLNHLARDYDFIQIPVLALRTPLGAFTHGIYCDEFAEFQTRDLRVRNRLGGFVPSAGVGGQDIRGERWKRWRARVRDRCSLPSVSPRITRTACDCTSSDSGRCLCRRHRPATVGWQRANTSRSRFGRRCGSARDG